MGRAKKARGGSGVLSLRNFGWRVGAEEFGAGNGGLLASAAAMLLDRIGPPAEMPPFYLLCHTSRARGPGSGLPVAMG
jgi:hypothetical protein